MKVGDNKGVLTTQSQIERVATQRTMTTSMTMSQTGTMRTMKTSDINAQMEDNKGLLAGIYDQAAEDKDQEIS